jgi:hypothetical protein
VCGWFSIQPSHGSFLSPGVSSEWKLTISFSHFFHAFSAENYRKAHGAQALFWKKREEFGRTPAPRKFPHSHPHRPPHIFVSIIILSLRLLGTAISDASVRVAVHFVVSASLDGRTRNNVERRLQEKIEGECTRSNEICRIVLKIESSS